MSEKSESGDPTSSTSNSETSHDFTGEAVSDYPFTRFGFVPSLAPAFFHVYGFFNIAKTAQLCQPGFDTTTDRGKNFRGSALVAALLRISKMALRRGLSRSEAYVSWSGPKDVADSPLSAPIPESVWYLTNWVECNSSTPLD
ncbi:hypothetical protein DFP73DRAFT_584358 [Morchella snyderi]|nr:hypothetical protein DFP73DRAFT_584358 [Morchella snyderi]